MNQGTQGPAWDSPRDLTGEDQEGALEEEGLFEGGGQTLLDRKATAVFMPAVLVSPETQGTRPYWGKRRNTNLTGGGKQKRGKRGGGADCIQREPRRERTHTTSCVSTS